jgi:hypothetical protein
MSPSVTSSPPDAFSISRPLKARAPAKKKRRISVRWTGSIVRSCSGVKHFVSSVCSSLSSNLGASVIPRSCR